MSNLTSERIYNLLPAIYRQRDVEIGEPLRALLAVMEQELVAIEQELGGLYDDWFIETCQEWVVPYIGDLLGVSGLSGDTSHLFSQRRHVANTVAYRRRKGVPAILERAAEDMTGWKARAVEYFRLLARTQHLHNINLTMGKSLNLRDRSAVAQLNTPFETAASFVDVRRITSTSTDTRTRTNRNTNQRGRYNISNVGLFLWRLSSFPITRSEAGKVKLKLLKKYYTFHPLGVDMPLFNQPQTKGDLTERTEPRHVPALLTRQALHYDLEAYRQALADNKTATSLYFSSQPVFQIWHNNILIPPEQIRIDDLSTDSPLANKKSYFSSDRGQVQESNFKVSVDPELGRMKFLEFPTREVRVSYAYGFSANIGGGSYDRRNTLAVASEQSWRALVSKSYSGNEGHGKFSDLQAAITEWATQSQAGIIQITDNSTYDLSEPINLSGKQQLIIEAADGMRPCLTGGLTVQGDYQPTLKRYGIQDQPTLKKDGPECQLILNGLLIGGIINLDGSLNLTINHCTLISGGIQQKGRREYHHLQITISNSLVGSLQFPPDMAQLTIQDSIIDSPSTGSGCHKTESAIAANDPNDPNNQYGPPTTLERVTVFGTVKVTQLTASEVIFTKPVMVQQRQVGYVRFSYVPPDSRIPQQYRCQPEFAVANAIEEVKKQDPEWNESKEQEIRQQIQLRLQPRFTSTQYGQPGYAQLSQQCALQITTGAENGAEMGVFQHLLQPQRAANLNGCLDQYLPVDLEAGIFYIS